MTSSSSIPPSGSNEGPGQAGPHLPTKIPKQFTKIYPASKSPAIKKWFQANFPSLGGDELDQAVSQFTMIQVQYMQHFMQQLDKQRKEANRRLRESEE